MNHDDNIIIVVARITDPCVPGSKIGKCDRCRSGIWIAPSSQRLLSTLEKEPSFLCVECYLALGEDAVKNAEIKLADKPEVIAEEFKALKKNAKRRKDN